MTREERDAWNERYANGTYTARSEPTPFLVEWLPRIPVGRALDVATGTGRNALHLAEAGFDVDAVDISEVAVQRGRDEAERRGLDIAWTVGDLDEDPLPPDAYDVITVIRYRSPSLWPRLRAALAPGGWVIVDHHLRTHLDAAGPRNPAFRLEPGELLDAFADLRVVHYTETIEPGDIQAGEFVIARIVACNGDPGW